jgi:uncharacterized protein (TIGR01777 family)
VRVVRSGTPSADTLRWDPDSGAIDASGLEGLDAVVHLAGAGIGDKKWTDERKQLILQSRVVGTTLLATTLAGLARPPSVLVSGSAIGWYGDRGDEELTEESRPPATPDFPSDVCRQWEAATAPAEAAGIRTVHLRTGIVLAAHGGTLAKLLTPFRLGLGGRQGSGRQYMSWIALDDEVGAILQAIGHDALAGPLNATAPAPATNAEFATTLGRVLGRPTILPTPTAPLKLVYGSELVERLLLAGQRVLPARLGASGYEFVSPTLEGALRRVLGKPA